MQALLLNVPRNPHDWANFSLHHRESHDLIRRAIQAKTGVMLPTYPIEPINLDDPLTFLQRNSQLHSDMNGVLGLSSNNLQDVNFAEERELPPWFLTHWSEHQSAEQALGIGS